MARSSVVSATSSDDDDETFRESEKEATVAMAMEDMETNVVVANDDNLETKTNRPVDVSLGRDAKTEMLSFLEQRYPAFSTDLSTIVRTTKDLLIALKAAPIKAVRFLPTRFLQYSRCSGSATSAWISFF